MNSNTFWRCAAMMVLALGTMFSLSTMTTDAAQSSAAATPASCDTPGTPTSASQAHSSMDMDSPVSQDIDLIYIDMMIPHHASIIALSQAALPRLVDERLRTLAQNVIDAQSAEIEELEGYRTEFYGRADAQPVDEQSMMLLMGDMGHSMDAMMLEMDATAQVAAICAALDVDVAFIDLTIPHHKSAIMASQVVVEQAVHPEIRDFAQRVIEAQESEIEQLQQIRLELTGSAAVTAPER